MFWIGPSRIDAVFFIAWRANINNIYNLQIKERSFEMFPQDEAGTAPAFRFISRNSVASQFWVPLAEADHTVMTSMSAGERFPYP
jgi:hypothetical protein